jgi:hypothetical protein
MDSAIGPAAIVASRERRGEEGVKAIAVTGRK